MEKDRGGVSQTIVILRPCTLDLDLKCLTVSCNESGEGRGGGGEC